jgi:hypothetical protein
LLSDDDKTVYRCLAAAIAAPSRRKKRNTRAEDFRQIWEAIECFENHDSENQWARCLVCGICRLTDRIAVNTGQLKRLVFKCKSSINGALAGLGWDTIVTNPGAADQLMEQIPHLRKNPKEARQWTIRTASSWTTESPEVVAQGGDGSVTLDDWLLNQGWISDADQVGDGLGL